MTQPPVPRPVCPKCGSTQVCFLPCGTATKIGCGGCSREWLPYTLADLAQFFPHPSPALPGVEELARKYIVREVETGRIYNEQKTQEFFAALRSLSLEPAIEAQPPAEIEVEWPGTPRILGGIGTRAEWNLGYVDGFKEAVQLCRAAVEKAVRKAKGKDKLK